jgi:cardiolipin synthase
LPATWRRWLLEGGVRLLFFRPEIARFSVKRQRLRRLHRKLAVIDGKVGFVGGINILDDESEPGLAPRYDYALSVQGPLVQDLRRAAARQWQHTAWTQLKHHWFFLPPAPPRPGPAGKMRARLVVRDNLHNRRAIEQAYLAAIYHAQHEVVLANAYFLPGRSLRQALLHAARRGVRVILLLQGRVDHALIFYASRVLYRPLLEAGVEIHEYISGFMHAKVGVVDRLWMTVGSSNIDPFSLLTAREANLVVEDPQLATELRDDLQRHIEQDAQPIDLARVTRMPWLQRITTWLAYQCVRMLLGLSGYGRREYRE